MIFIKILISPQPCTAGLCYDGVTPPVPVVYTTTTTTPPHYCWTPEPANEMVKLSTSAGSLCRPDTPSSSSDLACRAHQRSGRARGCGTVWGETGGKYCNDVTVVRPCVLSPLLSCPANINSLFQLPVMSAACSDDPSSSLLTPLCLCDLPVLGPGHWSVI